MRLSNKDKMLLFMAVTGLGALVLGLWALVLSLSTGTLRVWTAASAFIIPLAGFIGWRLGTRDARAHLSGIDKGVKSVMNAASQTADLRTTTTRRVRQVVSVTPPLSLPEPTIKHVSASSSEVIDL